MSEPRHHGLTLRESQIMDLYEAGQSDREIGQTLGIDFKYARAVIRELGFATCWNNSTTFDKNTRRSSRAYVAAIAAAGLRA